MQMISLVFEIINNYNYILLYQIGMKMKKFILTIFIFITSLYSTSLDKYSERLIDAYGVEGGAIIQAKALNRNLPLKFSDMIFIVESSADHGIITIKKIIKRDSNTYILAELLNLSSGWPEYLKKMDIKKMCSSPIFYTFLVKGGKYRFKYYSDNREE